MFSTAHRTTSRRQSRLLGLLVLPALLLSTLALSVVPAATAQSPAPAPMRYTAQMIEGPQGERFQAADLNNRGQVLGTLDAEPYDIPAIWEAGAFTRLPQMADELGEPYYPQVAALNDLGRALLYDRSELYLWDGGAYSPIVRADRYWWNMTYASAAEINNRGTVFAPINDSTGYPTKWTATIWNSGAFFYLTAPDSTLTTVTRDINEAGQAVGTFNVGSPYPGTPTAANSFRVVDNVLLPLTVPNSRAAYPLAINNQGQIAGFAHNMQFQSRPVVWQPDGSVADLPTGGATGMAIDINDQGDILGQVDGVGIVLWRAGVMYRLADLLPAEPRLSVHEANGLNDKGQILVRGTLPGVSGARHFLLSPSQGVTLDSLTLQRQDRESAAWLDLPEPGNIADGASVRAVASVRNTGTQTVTALIAFRNKDTGLGLPGCLTTIEVPPTAGAPLRHTCAIDTEGMAWADGDTATIGTRISVEVELTPAGQGPLKLDKPLTVRPRPVVFVPGIGGNYARDVSVEGDMHWLLNRGVAPDKLEIDPLIRSYDGLLRTLSNSGYTPGRDLFIANYDWRLVPGPSDRVYDGVITGLTPEGISDTTYQYGVDYLGDTLRVAAEVWRGAYKIPLDHVDVIAHSTGGLVTRTYIQSTAYGGAYTLTSDRLPKVRNFISVGVPHRGASKAWNPLHDNWGIDASFRVVLSKIVNRAFQKLDAGETISGPDGPITRVEITDPETGRLVPEWFIWRYVPTIRALMATYPFLNRGDSALDDANEGNFANHLVLDLNNGADITPGRDPNVFLAQTRLTAIGATSEKTPTWVDQRFGPADDVLSPFTDFFMNDAAEGQIYFAEVFVPNGGDGTVPTLSSVGQFVGDPRARVLTYQKGINTLGKVGHTDLTDNPEIQADILRTLGAPVKPEHLVALGRDDIENITSIVLDPVQGYIVDGQGRRLGWSDATGPLAEIPGSVWRGGGDGFGLVFGPVEGPLRLELRGLDEAYYAQVQQMTARGEVGGATLEGPMLRRDETRGATVELRAPASGEFRVHLPLVRR